MNHDDPHMPLLSMRVVTRMTGLSPDTIRVWERRYRAVNPQRTVGNARRYTTDEVRRLKLLHVATSLGLAIHDVAALDDTALQQLVQQRQTPLPTASKTSDKSESFALLRQEYLDAIQHYESANATRLLQRTAVLLGREDFLFGLVLPILRAVGDRWHRGELSVAHEHLVSAQLRAILQTDLRFTGAEPGAKRLLIAAAAGERHEFGVLVGALLAASRGFDTLYLGADLPWSDLLHAAHTSDADIVLVGFLHTLEPEAQTAAVQGLTELVRTERPTWVGLPPQHATNGAVAGIRYLNSFEALEAALAHEEVSR